MEHLSRKDKKKSDHCKKRRISPVKVREKKDERIRKIHEKFFSRRKSTSLKIIRGTQESIGGRKRLITSSNLIDKNIILMKLY